MTGSGIALLIAALLSASTIGPLDNVERITPEEAAERVAKCGLGPASVRYEDWLQSHILTVANATSATQGQLVCIDSAASYYDVELPPNVQPRFNAIREARWSAVFLAEARQWLSTRGLLGKVPKYIEGTTDEAEFTRQVEKLCGPRAQGAFQSQYGFHALSPDWAKKLGMPLKAEEHEAFSCLMNVATVAGFKVGFIGNEAVRQ